MARDVRVLAVDDQEVFLRACSRLVAATDGFCWAGAAASGPEALERLEDLEPDLVLMDVRMPGMDGLEATRRLVERHAEVVVVLVSVEAADGLPAALTSTGAAAHVRKHALSPAALQRLWAEHGVSGRSGSRPGPSSPARPG